MSDLSTKRLLAAYKEKAGAPGFLASTFSTGDREIHNSKEVEIDIRRSGRPIAIVVTDWKNGGRKNTLDLYTNKKYVPPVLFEELTMNATDLMDRQMGQDPFQDPVFMTAAQNKLSDGVEMMIDKIRRTVELQASQIYQTGAVNLYDKDGTLLYTVDFQMKADHKINATIDWDETTANPFLNLSTADKTARKNGRYSLDRWVFGDLAWDAFLSNSKIQALLDTKDITLGGIAPKLESEDQIYQGHMTINGSRAELYSYQASYDHPQTGVDTPYVSPWNVIGLSTKARRAATFGGIPRIVPVDPRLAPLGIGSMLAADKGLALTTNAYVSPNGENITAEVKTRPLLIPVVIDAHVCINAKVT